MAGIGGSAAGPARRRRVERARIRKRRIVLLGAVLVVLVVVLVPSLRSSGVPMTPLETRIVSAADREVGYHTTPRDSYCNRFSAYWDAGQATCPTGERSEEWCADFAAWTWRKAGVRFVYGYQSGEINGAAVSFYEWGVAHHTWHPAKGYVARPGDVAVYGLQVGGAGGPTAAHVAVVTSDPTGQPGPNVVNGDGDRTGFSVVEADTDQVRADSASATSVLSGYVAPPPVHGVSHSTS